MNLQPSDKIQTPPADPQPHTTFNGKMFTRRKIVFASISISIFAISEYLAEMLLRGRPHQVEIPVSVIVLLLFAILLGVVGLILHNLQTWRWPSRQLEKLIDEIHQGKAPLETLQQAPPSMKGIANGIQHILRDLKRQKGNFTQLENEMKQKVAQRTDALERAMGSLRAQATRDALTGLYNRRMLNDCLPNLIQQCAEDGLGLSLLMIDVDDFKLLNDTLGHAQGDDLLRAIGQLIRSSLRVDDLGFRCGGDEFVVVMPASQANDAQNVIKRLTDLVDALTKPLSVARKPRLSIGLATLEEVNMNRDARILLEKADQSLYAIKAKRKKLLGIAPRAA